MPSAARGDQKGKTPSKKDQKAAETKAAALDLTQEAEQAPPEENNVADELAKMAEGAEDPKQPDDAGVSQEPASAEDSTPKKSKGGKKKSESETPTEPAEDLEAKLAAQEAEQKRNEIDGLLQMIVDIIPDHQRVARASGYPTIATSLSAILATATNARKNIGDTEYWIRKVHK